MSELLTYFLVVVSGLAPPLFWPRVIFWPGSRPTAALRLCCSRCSLDWKDGRGVPLYSPDWKDGRTSSRRGAAPRGPPQPAGPIGAAPRAASKKKTARAARARASAHADGEGHDLPRGQRPWFRLYLKLCLSYIVKKGMQLYILIVPYKINPRLS